MEDSLLLAALSRFEIGQCCDYDSSTSADKLQKFKVEGYW